MIAAATLQGYSATTYAILPPGGSPVGLRLGLHSEAADALLTASDAGRICCLNAWNPRSRRMPVTRNMAAHQRLRREITQRGWTALPHLGVPDRPTWRAEPGFAVLDVEKEKAIRLAETYGQYGLVFYESGGVAELILTRLALR